MSETHERPGGGPAAVDRPVERPGGGPADEGDRRAALEAAVALLEAAVADRRVLADAPDELRERLLRAAGRVSLPQKTEHKLLARELRRRRKAEQVARDESQRRDTGIRKLRESAVFLTPPPVAMGSEASVAEAAVAESLVAEPTVVESVDDGRAAGTERAGDGSTRPGRGAAGPRLHGARRCYVCKAEYDRLHPFYDQLCPACGDFNFARRAPRGDLTGRVALVSGARVKIGYHAAILLLRAGAHVVVLTRFPRDAAARYAAEPDFEQWAGRLEIHGVDLRHTPSVEALCAALLRTHDRLDFLLNNACQTVRRPPGWYAHLMETELRPVAALPPAQARLIAGEYGPRRSEVLPATFAAHALTASGSGAGARDPGPDAAPPDGPSPALLSMIPLVPGDDGAGGGLFPAGQLDADRQQVDRRDRNSWRLMLDEVPAVELLEVHLVNAVAPFVLCGRLRPLMRAVPTRDKHIVNVSAVEGQFYRPLKTARHPHTNMAKASLNMMTRTAAADFINDGIHMNAVDTGWVTDEDPVEIAERKAREHAFSPPLDVVDGAARIVDPIFDGLATGRHRWGVFLKDYRVTDW